LQGTVLTGKKAGLFAVDGTGASLGTPVYTLEADSRTTNGVVNDRDNGKFTIAGADLLVGATPLQPGFYYIAAKVTMVNENGVPLANITPIMKAFIIKVETSSGNGNGGDTIWGD
jgi:hypothetical protein